jgi:DNA-binding NarL/FixJ family response regulator
VTVVVGVDGAGRTHRLGEIAAATTTPVIRIDGGAGADPELAARLEAAAADGALVIVDDAHRLPAGMLRTLAGAARRGVSMTIARRPTIDRPELAELDEAVAAQGTVELLGPLDERGVAAVMAAATGRPVGLDRVGPVREASAGLPALAAAIASGPPDVPAPALVARVQQRLAMLEPAPAELARILALRLDLDDEVLAAAAGAPVDGLAPAMRALRDRGMLVPDVERMIPAVAQAVLTDLPAVARRRLHDAVARALVGAGGDPVVAAGQLSAARARSEVAAQVYRDAGDRLRFDDPAAALAWYDDALDAGADPEALAPGRAEAGALVGRPMDGPAVLGRHSGDGPSRLALVAGAVAAQQGRCDRAAEALLAAGPPGPVLAVPALMATGRAGEAGIAAAGPGPVAVRRTAGAALAVADPGVALPLLIEAAEAVEDTPPAVVLPDTPHALAAVVAVTAGDAATAVHLLERALAAGTGGPVAGERHRVLLAWVRMRTGRYDTAVAELRRLGRATLPGRERLLVAALTAGIARRSGDIARLREAWAGAEPVLARRSVDLFQLEPLEELLVAAARLGEHRRLEPVLDALDGIVERLGGPAAWAVSLGWIRLQVAVAGEDPLAAATAARVLADAAPPGERQRAQCAAAGYWARVLAGDVDPDPVVRAAEELAAAQLPWEASRLVGHAAIRTADPAAARRLLERARDLANLDGVAGGEPGGSRGGLSDREVEVARLVLAGRTHREIGAQLYLSPKTVEHHVARIRTKLGATSRAELVAALHEVLGEQAGA